MAFPIPASSGSSPSNSIPLHAASRFEHKRTSCGKADGSASSSPTKSETSKSCDVVGVSHDASSGQSCSSFFDSSCSSTFSIPSQGSSRRIRHLRHIPKIGSSRGHQTDAASSMRRRYLHRLGIDADPSSGIKCLSSMSDHDSQDTNSHQEEPFQGRANRAGRRLSSSLPGIIGQIESFRSIPSHQSVGGVPRDKKKKNREQEVLLLKNSVQYTTDLKFDKSMESASSNFELSSDWTSYLLSDTRSANDNVETSKICSSNSFLAPGCHEQKNKTEPIDGAFDLFSLPSDPSITAFPENANALSAGYSTEASPDFVSIGSSFSLISMYHSSARSLNSSLYNDKLSYQEDSMNQSAKPRRKVSFNTAVKAATIPPHSSYSDRIRTRLWSSSEDIYANAIRNEIEYAYDGSDWRNVREEGNFVRYPSDFLQPSEKVNPEEPGQLVHPVHFSGWVSSPHTSTMTSSSILKNRQEQPALTGPNAMTHSMCGDEDIQQQEDDIYSEGVFAFEMNSE